MKWSIGVAATSLSVVFGTVSLQSGHDGDNAGVDELGGVDVGAGVVREDAVAQGRCDGVARNNRKSGKL